jgi:glycosyltransferase involved in cell wall biosynthesis
VRIAYVTPYYNGNCDGRFGRFHDWIHKARDMDNPPFEFDIYAFTSSSDDQTLAVQPRKQLGEATELWGTKLNKPEFVLNIPRIRSRLNSGEYDLIHVLVMDTIVFPTVLSVETDTPLVVGPNIAGWSPVRRGMFTSESPIEKIKNRLRFGIKNVLTRVTSFDQVIVFSQHHQKIVESFGIPSDKIDILHGGVSSRFSPGDSQQNNEPPELLYVGDFTSHKGYPLFLNSLSAIERPVRARVIGAGDADRSYMRQLGIADQVTVEGFVPRSKLPEYYRKADLYINPSTDELGPNTLLEALACGTPVVATDVLGINEFTPPEGSILFDSRTVDSLSSSINEGLNKIDKLTNGARSVSGQYNVNHTLEDLSDIYSDVIPE